MYTCLSTGKCPGRCCGSFQAVHEGLLPFGWLVRLEST